MIETWIIAFLFARRKYNIRYLFSNWTIYPPLIMLLVYIFAEMMIFNDNYWITQYGKQIKQLTLLSYFGLVYQYELYKSTDGEYNELCSFLKSPFMLAIFCLVVGYLLNYIAIAANSGHMPVFASISYSTGYTDIESFTKDSFYILGDYTCKLIFLTDTMDFGFSNLSMGDLFVRGFVFILLYNAIKKSTKIQK